MEPTRAIYWNVGHGVIAPMYLLVAAATAALAWGFARRLRVWRRGRPVDRLDHPWARAAEALRAALGQRAVLRAPRPGVPHALFLWSFAVLFAGTLLVMLQADLSEPLLGRTFLRGRLYLAFSAALDLAGLVALGGLAALLVRRVLLRGRLESRREDWGVHALLFAILVTGFLVEAVRIAATELGAAPALARWSPVGAALARTLPPMAADTASALHLALWWIHLALVLGFVAALPWTKLRHAVTTPLGRLFADRRPRGTLDTPDLEAEGATFGASRAVDLTWKDLFDADACTGCERCQRACPAHATGKPLSPLRVVREIGAAAATAPEASLLDAIGRDAIWSCTTCFACQDACPASVEHVRKVVDLRRHLALMEGEFPGDEVRTAAGNVEVSGNPFGFAPATRADWADGLDVSVAGDGRPADVLYFAGCYASFDRRNREVARSFVKVCNAAGVRVAILGKREGCCGEPIRKLGNEYLFQQSAQKVIDAIHASGAKQVVTTCAHCFGALSRDYLDLGLSPSVEHHTTFIARLAEAGRLWMDADAAPLDCTFHDSCYLGRYAGIYDAPRAVLAAAGARVVEMERSGADAACCGGGGGRILAEERLGSRINVARAEMARATGAPVVVAACPFCLSMLEDGLKAGGDGPRVKDLAEIVAERIGG
ncbi:MAG TPA: heterodisulfide reductase-related iron-sulfur binding cluster [Anaeromyxobacteraceae bacterium]|nr:heterodisulfide reductase-related iron-sulfur binding cluster [Anaeromyxobacteraceae bacterium]